MAQTIKAGRVATRDQSSNASRRTSITPGRAEQLLQAEAEVVAAVVAHMVETEREAKTSAAKESGKTTVAVIDTVALRSSITSAPANQLEALVAAAVEVAEVDVVVKPVNTHYSYEKSKKLSDFMVY